jgi:hypothetical protein
MRGIEPILPSDASRPGIDWLLEPARDRIISLASGWVTGLLNCLKRAGSGRKALNSLKFVPPDYGKFYGSIRVAFGRGIAEIALTAPDSRIFQLIWLICSNLLEDAGLFPKSLFLFKKWRGEQVFLTTRRGGP